MLINRETIEAGDSATVLEELGQDVILVKKDTTQLTIKAIIENESRQTSEYGEVLHVPGMAITFWENVNLDDIDYFLIGGKKYKFSNRAESFVEYLGKSKTLDLVNYNV